MSPHNILVINECAHNGTLATASTNEWRLITDSVMGGVSKGYISQDMIAGRPCLRMRGDVSLENNGGFVQMALDLPDAVKNKIGDIVGPETVFIK